MLTGEELALLADDGGARRLMAQAKGGGALWWSRRPRGGMGGLGRPLDARGAGNWREATPGWCFEVAIGRLWWRRLGDWELERERVYSGGGGEKRGCPRGVLFIGRMGKG